MVIFNKKMKYGLVSIDANVLYVKKMNLQTISMDILDKIMDNLEIKDLFNLWGCY